MLVLELLVSTGILYLTWHINFIDIYTKVKVKLLVSEINIYFDKLVLFILKVANYCSRSSS